MAPTNGFGDSSLARTEAPKQKAQHDVAPFDHSLHVNPKPQLTAVTASPHQVHPAMASIKDIKGARTTAGIRDSNLQGGDFVSEIDDLNRIG